MERLGFPPGETHNLSTVQEDSNEDSCKVFPSAEASSTSFTFLPISMQSYALPWCISISLPVLLQSILLLVICYHCFRLMLELTRRMMTVSIQLTGSLISYTLDDRLYSSLLLWLHRNVPQFQTDKISVQDDTDDEDSEDYNPHGVAPSQREYKLEHSIGYGTHWFLYKGAWILISRERTPQVIYNKNSTEMITLSTLRWNVSSLRDLIEVAKPKPKKVSDKKLLIYKADVNCQCWTQLGGPKKKRDLDSIVLQGDVMQRLVNDIDEFLSLEEWYIDRGIPYRRGYLLYGPPGCGKSSVIKAIAGKINYDICVLSLSQKLTDDAMTELLNRAPTKSIILLEDIDAAFRSRETIASSDATSREANLAFEGAGPSALTFRGLLNALDGVASAEDGQIIFMTTNYPDRLDPALVRPGRVDLKINIDHPTDLQLEGMFARFYPQEGDELKKAFVQGIRALGINMSMAMTQGLFLVYKNDGKKAVEGIKDHFESQFTNVKEVCNGLYC